MEQLLFCVLAFEPSVSGHGRGAGGGGEKTQELGKPRSREGTDRTILSSFLTPTQPPVLCALSTECSWAVRQFDTAGWQ